MISSVWRHTAAHNGAERGVANLLEDFDPAVLKFLQKP